MLAQREALLSETFVTLADTLVTDFDIVDFLSVLSARCVDLFDAGGAGLMLADESGRMHLAASSSHQMRLLELLELQHDDGPCPDAYRTGVPVSCPDLRDAADRWPTFAPAALEAGFRSAHALPMRLRDKVIGALNLIRVEPGPMPAEDIAAAQALADVATIGILHHRAVQESQLLTEQLQYALDSRVVIEQAKGVVAHRLDRDMDQAFNELRSFSRNNNRRLVDVATGIVDRTIDPDDLLVDPVIEPPSQLHAAQQDQAGGQRDRDADDRDRDADERDQAGLQRDRDADNRDRDADKRDQAGASRDQAGGQRDSDADDRDRNADERDHAGAARDQAGGQRDRDADERDRAAEQRDRDADQRDRAAELAEAGPSADIASDIAVRLAQARREAAADRRQASRDRRAAARERNEAELDRGVALVDRGVGAGERSHAELDRGTSLADRGAGAGDRIQSELDRGVALGDRGTRAGERSQAEHDRGTSLADRIQTKAERTSRDSAHLVREAAIESTGRAREAALVEAQAVDRAEMMAEVALVRQLQANLLPQSLPEIASVELSAHYESADDRVEIGGDWYDAFLVDADHLGISIGDVSGHGIAAASLMAHARLSLQLAVLGGSSPGVALRQLDALLARVSGGTEFATAVVGIYSLADDVFCWARAGHCFPVLRTGGGSMALTGRCGPPVGVGLVNNDFPEHRTRLSPGDLIVLYTDGLVERRRRPVTEGTDALTELVQAWDGQHLDGLVQSLPALLSVTETPEDDICLLAIRRTPDLSGDPSPIGTAPLLDA